VRILLTCALVVLTAFPQSPPQRPPARPPTGQQEPAQQPRQKSQLSRVRSATGEALDRYARGEYATAIAILQQLGGFNIIQAQAWINAMGSGAAGRRRLVAATMVLEYTDARPGLSPPLIEWACEQLTKYPSPELEQLWLRASIALVEGHQAWAILTGATSSHLAHARARFPDNAYYKLAEAVSVEAAASDPSVGPKATDTGMVVDRLGAEMVDRPADRASQPVALLEKAAAAFEPLLGDAVVGSEAHLRLGYVQLRLSRRDLALQHFAHVDSATSDDYLKYLGRLFSGWTLARDGETDKAIAAYRSALDIIPRARSATTLLTILLVMHHKLEDAESAADTFMSVAAAPDDPWRTYQLGDYRSYAGLLDQLREAIR
jgi:tetratricopeptide (TPR) repeat protein